MIKRLNIKETKSSNADILDSIEANAKAILDKVATIRKGAVDDYNLGLLKKQKKALIDVNSAMSNISSYASAYTKENSERMHKKSVTEGDASKKTNYAVMVRNMNNAKYNLYTGTKAECEELLDILENLESLAATCEDEDEYCWEESFVIDTLSNYNCIEEIYYRMIDNNDNYSLGGHYSEYGGMYSGMMVHIINADSPIDLYL